MSENGNRENDPAKNDTAKTGGTLAAAQAEALKENANREAPQTDPVEQAARASVETRESAASHEAGGFAAIDRKANEGTGTNIPTDAEASALDGQDFVEERRDHPAVALLGGAGVQLGTRVDITGADYSRLPVHSIVADMNGNVWMHVRTIPPEGAPEGDERKEELVFVGKLVR